MLAQCNAHLKMVQWIPAYKVLFYILNTYLLLIHLLYNNSFSPCMNLSNNNSFKLTRFSKREGGERILSFLQKNLGSLIIFCLHQKLLKKLRPLIKTFWLWSNYDESLPKLKQIITFFLCLLLKILDDDDIKRRASGDVATHLDMCEL